MEPFAAERIFLLSDDDVMMRSLADDLVLWGLPIRAVQVETASFLKTMSHEVSDEIVLIQLRSDTLLTDISRLRVDFPTAGILVLYADRIVTTEKSSLLLLAGADICFDEGVRGVEVLASIQALRRRGLALRSKYSMLEMGLELEKKHDNAAREPEMIAEPSGVLAWELREGGWRLLTPQRQSIALTGAERHVLRTLLKHSPNPVSREELFSDQRDSTPPKRYIDVVVSRLRRKVSQFGEHLPIHSVWGVGYAFSAD
ncbi:MAG: winged helix-turn-helix domain-containing protein [Paenalcaligenes sp.]